MYKYIKYFSKSTMAAPYRLSAKRQLVDTWIIWVKFTKLSSFIQNIIL